MLISSCVNEIILKCKNDENQKFEFNIKVKKEKDSIKLDVSKKNETNDDFSHCGYLKFTEEEFNNLRRQLNNELKQLISFQIRLQRAGYDKKYYRICVYVLF